MKHEQERKAVIEIMCVIRDTIKEAKEIPSGHLYAVVMKYMSLESYNKVIQALKDAKLITEQNYLIRWIGTY